MPIQEAVKLIRAEYSNDDFLTSYESFENVSCSDNWRVFTASISAATSNNTSSNEFMQKIGLIYSYVALHPFIFCFVF